MFTKRGQRLTSQLSGNLKRAGVSRDMIMQVVLLVQHSPAGLQSAKDLEAKMLWGPGVDNPDRYVAEWVRSTRVGWQNHEL